MSSSGDITAEIAYVAENVELSLVQNYCIMATTALVFYEHFCTLSQEVDVIWSRKKTGATLLFLLNRFATAGFGIAMLLLVPNWGTLLACKAVNLVLPAFQLLLSLIWAVFSALRVFAISGRSWRTASFVFALGMVPVGTNLVGDIRESYALISVPFYGVASSDVLVLLVTWGHTYRIRKEASAVNLRAPIVTLLLRDGTIYFTLLLVLNVLHLALEYTDVFWDITYFVTGSSSIIDSRFLLNLRQVHQEDEMLGSQPSFVASRASRLIFASTVVGNLGEHLDHGLSISTSDVFPTTYAESEECTDVDVPAHLDRWDSEREEPSSPSDDEIHTPV